MDISIMIKDGESEKNIFKNGLERLDEDEIETILLFLYEKREKDVDKHDVVSCLHSFSTGILND